MCATNGSIGFCSTHKNILFMKCGDVLRIHRHGSVAANSTEQLNQDYLTLNKINFVKTKKEHDSFVTPMCNIGNRGLYVSADGVLHPCSWVSFPYTSMSTDRKTIHFQDSFHQVHREKLNLKTHSLEQVLNEPVWGQLFNTFDNPEKAWVECEQKCNCKLVTEDYAVGWLTN